MINIFRDDKLVRVTIEGGPLNSTYHFSFDCGDKHYAELLADRFNEQLWNRVENVRKLEYNQGYKDGRSKKEKKKYFYSSLKDAI